LPFTSAVDHWDVFSPYRLARICLTGFLQRERGAHEHPELAGVNRPRDPRQLFAVRFDDEECVFDPLLAKEPNEVVPYKILPFAVESVKQVALSRLSLFNSR
jgi:hypothetical protein